MRIGLATIFMKRLGGTWDEALDTLLWQAQFGDRAGLGNLWLTEHHFTEGGATNSPGTLLAWLAAQTTRIRLGYSVSLLPFQHPLRIAEEMLLVDRLSRGRLDIGVGRGHAPLEVAAFCPDPDQAVSMFNDTVEVIRHAFAAEPFRLQGEYWNLPEVQLYPPPFPRPYIEMYMPITSPRSVEFAAGKAISPLLGSRARHELRETVDAYAAAAERAGLPAAQVAWLLDRASGSRFLAFAASREEAEQIVRDEVAYFHHGHYLYQLPVGHPDFYRDMRPVPPLDLPAEELQKFAIWGTRDDIVDQVRDLEAHGLRQLSLSVDAACTAPEVSRRRLERFAADVLPHIADAPVA